MGSVNKQRLGDLLAEVGLGGRWSEGLLAPRDRAEPRLFLRARRNERCGRVRLVIRDFRQPAGELPDLSRLFGLTPMEHRVVSLLLSGLAVNDIAEAIGNSVLTVRTHLKHSYGKLGVSTKEQLFAIVLRLICE